MLQIISILIVTFSLSPTLFAAENNHPAKETLTSLSAIDPLLNEIVIIKPVPNHHFNLAAPQDCGPEATTNPAAKAIFCQFHQPGEKTVKVSVCDDKKSYCKPETLKVNVRNQPSKTPRLKAPIAQQTLEMQDKMKKKLLSGFQFLTPEQTRAEVKNKKAVLLLVSTEWCPPCNSLKEFMMQSQSFKEATKDYLLVYVDGDSTLVDSWKSILETYFFPTFLVLNKKMEVVDLKVGDSHAYEFTEWLDKASQHLNDPLPKLEKRLVARRKNGNWQKVLDLFASAEQRQQDELRWIQVLEDRNQTEELVTFLKSLPAAQYKNKLPLAEYRDAYVGKKSAQYDRKEKPEVLNKLAGEVFKQPIDTSKPDVLYFWLAVQHCTGQKEIASKKCDTLLDEAISSIKNFFVTNKSKLLPHEIIIAETNLAQYDAMVSEAKGNSEAAAGFYKQCQDLGKSLAAHTPLSEKSRAIAFMRLDCLEGTKSSEDLELLQSLVEEYPYDTTFHGKLADYYMGKKDFVKALAANDKAIQYAYGDWWAKSIEQRVRILKGLQKDKEALQLIESSLNEISLNEGDQKQWWLNSLRSNLDELRKKVVQ